MDQTSFSIPPDHPSLPGHFPGGPVVPGVLVLDRVLAAIPREPDAAIEIEVAKFLAPVRPGQLVQMVWHRISGGSFGFRCTVDSSTVLQGRIRIASECQ